MDENDLRLAAAEYALISIGAKMQREDVAQAIAQLAIEAAQATGDERIIKAAAMELLRDGLNRWDDFTGGVLFRPAND